MKKVFLYPIEKALLFLIVVTVITACTISNDEPHLVAVVDHNLRENNFILTLQDLYTGKVEIIGGKEKWVCPNGPYTAMSASQFYAPIVRGKNGEAQLDRDFINSRFCSEAISVK